MKNIILIPLIVCTFIYPSCLTSIQPLVTAEKIISEDRVVGTWLLDDDTIRIERFNESVIFKELIKIGASVKDLKLDQPKIIRDDSILYAHGYTVSFQKDGIDYFMFGAVTSIGNQLYIDLLPIVAGNTKNEVETGYEYTNDYLPAFTMAKLEISKNGLNLHFLNGDFIKEQIRNGNVRIKHEKDELFETFVVTASSGELRQFIEKYGHDQRLFSKENSVTLTRKG